MSSQSYDKNTGLLSKIAGIPRTLINAIQTQLNSTTADVTNALAIERSTSAFPTGDAYSSTSAYKVGDHVIYNNKLYKCKTACSAASWNVNSTNFEETTLTKVATQLNKN